MTDFKAIRKWPRRKREARLKELGEVFRKEWAEDRVPEAKLLDESVVIWLETMRSAFPSDSPLERLHDLVLGHEEPGPAFGLMSLRFMETAAMIEQFKAAADRREQLRLRPALVARGVI